MLTEDRVRAILEKVASRSPISIKDAVDDLLVLPSQRAVAVSGQRGSLKKLPKTERGSMLSSRNLSDAAYGAMNRPAPGRSAFEDMSDADFAALEARSAPAKVPAANAAATGALVPPEGFETAFDNATEFLDRLRAAESQRKFRVRANDARMAFPLAVRLRNEARAARRANPKAEYVSREGLRNAIGKDIVVPKRVADFADYKGYDAAQEKDMAMWRNAGLGAAGLAGLGLGARALMRRGKGGMSNGRKAAIGAGALGAGGLAALLASRDKRSSVEDILDILQPGTLSQ